ncbi:MAG TPA: bifunctional DNA primase/polymerase [Streptosporangiaceae bacterium]|nr:bifunctional DNA primase/polymerase [Streptosporangiaceae bacterium]
MACSVPRSLTPGAAGRSFPCQPGAKEPATRHGFRDSSTDPDRIRSWWRRMPDANVAIATGSPGPDVLDVDQHGQAGNGFTAYRQLAQTRLLDGTTTIVATPNGGLHLYFSGTGQPWGG